jgi:hypothetical protein
MSKDNLSLSLKIRPWTARMFLPRGSVVLACLGARRVSLSPFAMSWIPSPPNFPLLCNVVFRLTLSLVQIGVSIDEMSVSMCPCLRQSWQLVAKSIKVIDKSDEAIEPRYQPILPTTEKHKSSPSVTGFAVQKRMRPGK